MDRIRPDYSVPLTTDDGESHFSLDPRYDFIRVFSWLGMGIVNVVTEEGVARLYVDEETCWDIHKKSEIPLVELEWITESENENMREIQADNLEDLWDE